MVRPCCLVDALIAVPENKIGQTFHHVWDQTAESSFKKIGKHSKMAHQSPSGMMVRAGLKQ